MMKYPAVVLLILVALVQAVPEGRILSGYNAIRGQFPHQILMNRTDGLFCGGSIISRNYILTAAHCVYNNRYLFPPDSFTIFAGSNYVGAGFWFPVANIIAHEFYEGPGIHDIALMQLQTPLTFSYDIRPIALSRFNPPLHEEVVISGYGALNNFGLNPQVLQWTHLRTIPTETCRNKFSEFINSVIFWNSVICLDHYKGHGACYGDSGGPVTFKNELVGVCSFGGDKCGNEQPNVYTRVIPYLQWIEKHSDYREFMNYEFKEYNYDYNDVYDDYT